MTTSPTLIPYCGTTEGNMQLTLSTSLLLTSKLSVSIHTTGSHHIRTHTCTHQQVLTPTIRPYICQQQKKTLTLHTTATTNTYALTSTHMPAMQLAAMKYKHAYQPQLLAVYTHCTQLVSQHQPTCQPCSCRNKDMHGANRTTIQPTHTSHQPTPARL
jgi:hypothetical protein